MYRRHRPNGNQARLTLSSSVLYSSDEADRQGKATDMPRPRKFRKFSPAEVMALLDRTQVPLPTIEIARRLREQEGLPPYEPTGTPDVTDALTALVAAGKLVTAKFPGYGRACPDDTDAHHRHIIRNHDRQSRWYATPAVSQAWAEHLADVARDLHRADTLVDIVAAAWTAQQGPDSVRTVWPSPGEPFTPEPGPKPIAIRSLPRGESYPRIEIVLATDQAEWLARRLTGSDQA
jgi:hypothetical protein